jgi:hypothetical protein
MPKGQPRLPGTPVLPHKVGRSLKTAARVGSRAHTEASANTILGQYVEPTPERVEAAYLAVLGHSQTMASKAVVSNQRSELCPWDKDALRQAMEDREIAFDWALALHTLDVLRQHATNRKTGLA